MFFGDSAGQVVFDHELMRVDPGADQGGEVGGVSGVELFDLFEKERQVGSVAGNRGHCLLDIGGHDGFAVLVEGGDFGSFDNCG